jgi:glycosyltransferase involved in cell wall biosynthesis
VTSPVISVIVPVFNRDATLRRALSSVIRQTDPRFECIVVDDGSNYNISAIVASFHDPRFRYVRRDVTGGPYAARITGQQAMQGAYAVFLDSDDELYPWALAQARLYLDSYPEVDLVCALYVRDDSRLLVRVRDAPRIVMPADARRESAIPDRVTAVRRNVVDGWLAKRNDYFALEAHQFLTAKLKHTQLYVDEPWALCHIDGGDRVTRGSGNTRALDDYALFVAEHASLIADSRPSVLLDAILESAYFALRRARRPEAAEVACALRQRGISPKSAFIGVAMKKARLRLPGSRREGTTWV